MSEKPKEEFEDEDADDIEEAEGKLARSYAAKLDRVLPGRKTARYLQIERKIRAVLRYELADKIPLVK